MRSFWQRTITDPITTFTLCLVIANAWLILVGIIQLKHLTRAEYIAEKAANAAQKSAEIAEKALIAGQRAFISVGFVPEAIINISTGQIETWNFIPIWKNSGNTPTKEMHNHISIKIFDGPMPKDWDFPDLWSRQTRPNERLPVLLPNSAHGEVQGQHVGGLSIDQMREIIVKNKMLYMWGWATYNDVFPGTPKHVTRFCVQIIVGGDPTDNRKTSVFFPFIPRYNCSDEECDRQGYSIDWKPREKVE